MTSPLALLLAVCSLLPLAAPAAPAPTTASDFGDAFEDWDLGPSAPVVDRPVATPAEPLDVSVVVAARDLRPGKGPLIRADVVTRRLPESCVPRYTCIDVRDAVGRCVTETVFKGEIVSLARLVRADETPEERLQSHVPPDHRAVALTVGVSAAEAGWLAPPKCVDLVAVPRSGRPSDAWVVAQRVRVVEAGAFAAGSSPRMGTVRLVLALREGRDLSAVEDLERGGGVRWRVLHRRGADFDWRGGPGFSPPGQ